MPEHSAGILPYRSREGRLEVYLGHMGGPFWSRKDAAAWSIIKGAVEEGETPLQAAVREFAEETGLADLSAYDSPTDLTLSAHAVPDYVLLGEFRQPSGKRITVFVAVIADVPTEISGNTFDLEWPPRSGKVQSFPEIDAAGWFDLRTARVKLVRGQVQIIDALERMRVGLPEYPADHA